MGKLVAYSGFSSSNYLQQPYNSDLDFGTGDFCIMGWIKSDSTGTQTIICRQDKNVSSGFGTGNTVRFQVYSGTTIAATVGSSGTSTAFDYDTNTWHFVCAVKRNGNLELWANGKLLSSAANTGSADNTNAVTNIGVLNYNGSITDPIKNLALTRISATAPTAEQIKTIYESEKHLFTEGAQATLYGTSDAVTALAYDDTTDLLHVGTSAGRSVFSGLRRVSNTTDAVGTAISASNGLIAEE